MTPCSPLSFTRRFGGTYRLHLQGRRNRFSKPASKQVATTAVKTSNPVNEFINSPVGFLALAQFILLHSISLPVSRKRTYYGSLHCEFLRPTVISSTLCTNRPILLRALNFVAFNIMWRPSYCLYSTLSNKARRI
jgi:hypothetical protein